MLTEKMPTGAAETARKRLLAAAEDLDDNQVAGLVLDLAAEAGVAPVWEQVCLPLLGGLRGDSPADIAVEHALSEGVRVGLDVFRREPGRPLPPRGVLLAGAEHETHCLGLHALAAALRERGQGCLHLGPALPWSALAGAVSRARPRVVVVWSQAPLTGRAYRLVRLRRDFPGVRVFAAGPGWIEPFPPGPSAPRHVTTLPEATAACLQGGAPS
ncbi:transcriptional regulator [Micromonospora sp. WMMD980]|uniref:transcriptional regulator n=1 Tax=Micromonospora sp. WMMD980 TaxID=3016088 RepID=UPI002416E4CF|nr:transcriptional regulator [Micromonospora sp. WMMD980]MDG4801603.1 transcriptional regulator [Micromonospora sp. WMMD980]